MHRLTLPLTIVLFASACANTCGPDEKKPGTTRAATTSAEGGAGEGGIHGSRFAKPFVPGAANTTLPERDM
jgi:hypothetical protein